ncbi:MAG: hypothetical protein ACKV2V_24985 [Blastocatellia bacterium]
MLLLAFDGLLGAIGGVFGRVGGLDGGVLGFVHGGPGGGPDRSADCAHRALGGVSQTSSRNGDFTEGRGGLVEHRAGIFVGGLDRINLLDDTFQCRLDRSGSAFHGEGEVLLRHADVISGARGVLFLQRGRGVLEVRDGSGQAGRGGRFRRFRRGCRGRRSSRWCRHGDGRFGFFGGAAAQEQGRRENS